MTAPQRAYVRAYHVWVGMLIISMVHINVLIALSAGSDIRKIALGATALTKKHRLRQWGPFKCYVTQCGRGGSTFPGKRITKVYGGEWGSNFQEKTLRSTEQKDAGRYTGKLTMSWLHKTKISVHGYICRK